MKLSNLVNMPVGKFESETQACPTKHYNRGFNDAVLKVSNLPVNETKLRKQGWCKVPSQADIKRMLLKCKFHLSEVIHVQAILTEPDCEEFHVQAMLTEPDCEAIASFIHALMERGEGDERVRISKRIS